MNLSPELMEIRSRCRVELPMCHTHTDRIAVAFCGACRKPICESCLTVMPVEPRCPQCKSVTAVLPSHAAWFTGFLGGLWRRAWVWGFVIAAVVFAALLLLLPGIMQPEPPELPKALRGTKLDVPYLEKAYRLGVIGDLFTAKGKHEPAKPYYERSVGACAKHLEQEKEPYLRLQARIGAGRLQAKAGDVNTAIRTFETVISDAKNKPVAGAAHFYLGQIYEFTAKNNAKALAHYREALSDADRRQGAYTMLDYLADDGAGGKSVYAIAALTDTITSASAVRAKIAESIEKITGEKVEAGVSELFSPPDGTGEQKPAGDEDPLIIIKGR